jgi:hypothetical protein
MKRIVILALLAMALPLASFASSSVYFTNGGGVLLGSSEGMSLTGSELIAVNGLSGELVVGALGSLSFSTGSLISGGSLQMGGSFNGGGNFTIIGNGSFGIPDETIFTGSFSGPVTWTLITLANGTHNYTLTGSITGAWYNGAAVQGATVQLTINTGKGYFNESTNVSGGGTNIVVPEPDTLGLLGTGLIGLAGALHRKSKA